MNSAKRMQYARHIGCDSADGTILAFGPMANIGRVRGWLRSCDQPQLRLL